jgi:hypothetical protein
MSSVWSFRAIADAAQAVQAQAAGEKEEEKNMARRKLTLKEQLRGIRAALRSKRTPPQLREGLRLRAEWLRKMVQSRKGSK